MFMFTEIHCSGLKDSRFNEQLLLAGLKMFVRDSDRAGVGVGGLSTD